MILLCETNMDHLRNSLTEKINRAASKLGHFSGIKSFTIPSP